MASEKIQLTKEHKEKIKVALAVYDRCNEKERQFLDTCKKIVTDNGNWHMTTGRAGYLDSIVKYHVTGNNTEQKTEEHNGDFHAFETNQGWQVYFGEVAIGTTIARVEVVPTIAFLAYNILDIVAAYALLDNESAKLPEDVKTEVIADRFPEVPEGAVDVTAEVVENDGLLYADPNSPTGYCDSNDVAVNDDLTPYTTDDLPFLAEDTEDNVPF